MTSVILMLIENKSDHIFSHHYRFIAEQKNKTATRIT